MQLCLNCHKNKFSEESLRKRKKSSVYYTEKKAELLVRIYLFVVVVFLFNLPFFFITTATSRMDFIDFDTFTKDASGSDNDVFPQPQPPLSLPIASNLDQFSKKLSNLVLPGNILNNDNTKPSNEISEVDNVMEKYAKMSIDLIKRETGDVQLENEEDSKESSVRTSLSTRLSRVLNDSLSDATIREIFSNLQERFDKESNGYVVDLIELGIVGSMSRKI